MKIIITYASCGTGHRRAAEAVYNYFKENCPAHDLKIIDALQKTNFVFRNLYSYGYLFLVNHALWLWHSCFWLTSVSCLRPLVNILIPIINRLNAKNFSNFLIQEKPDFIISTHFFPSEIATNLKRINKFNSKLISVITDFGIHPFWILAGTDMYIVASRFSKEQLILEGVHEDIIKDFGIPIDSKFLKQYEKDILCKKFEIEPNKFTILISTGSFGIGQIEEIVDSLYKEVQILVVSAHNKILYARLRKRNYPNARVFGFIDNMQELMAVSDMIITKPGGLTISESLAMGLLPIFITAIPGQETENAKILAKKSIGLNLKDIASLKDIVLDFRDHPDKLKNMKEKINELKRPSAVKEICNVICQGSIWATC
jgi:processive 1,2-diacylglycerol beta-glucosyltransferase